MNRENIIKDLKAILGARAEDEPDKIDYENDTIVTVTNEEFSDLHGHSICSVDIFTPNNTEADRIHLIMVDQDTPSTMTSSFVYGIRFEGQDFDPSENSTRIINSYRVWATLKNP